MLPHRKCVQRYILMIIALAVYLFKVKLTEKRHEEIVAELEERLK